MLPRYKQVAIGNNRKKIAEEYVLCSVQTFFNILLEQSRTRITVVCGASHITPALTSLTVINSSAVLPASYLCSEFLKGETVRPYGRAKFVRDCAGIDF